MLSGDTSAGGPYAVTECYHRENYLTMCTASGTSYASVAYRGAGLCTVTS
jgi:hypothetical protein